MALAVVCLVGGFWLGCWVADGQARDRRRTEK